MPENIQRLLDRRATNWEGMKVLAEASAQRDLSAEEREEWDRRETEISRDSEDIDRLERFAKMSTVETKPIEELRKTEMTKGEVVDAEEHERAFAEYLVRGEMRLTEKSREVLDNYRAATDPQAAGANADGGYTVPPGFLVRMTETLKAYGGLLNLAEVIPTTSGNPLQFPTHDGTAEVGAIIAENVQDAVNHTQFGTKTLSAFMYTSKIILVSLELLQDSAFDMNTWLPGRLGQRIGRALAAHFATGAGTTQPEGLATNITTGVTAASSTVFTTNEVVDLIHSIDPAYRELNPAFLCNDAVVKFVRKLLDSTGRPIWQPSIQAGVPSSLYGYPVHVDQGFASAFTTGQKLLYFGDYHQGYMVRQVAGAQTVTLRERYADFRQVGYMGFSRWDAKPNDPAAVRVLKLA